MDTSHSLGICTKMLQLKLCHAQGRLIPRGAALVPCFGWRYSGDVKCCWSHRPVFSLALSLPMWGGLAGLRHSPRVEKQDLDMLAAQDIQREQCHTHSWHQERAAEPSNTLQRANCNSSTRKEEKNNNFHSCVLRGSLLFLDLL